MEETPLSQARKWLLENPTESVAATARLFHIPKSSLQSHITRHRATQNGGQNRVLTIAQLEALKLWIIQQYELGLGATRQMVFAAICHLRKPLPPPSQSWLTKLIKNQLQDFHFITTKPIAQQRVRAQDEDTVEEWFQKYFTFVLEYNIKPESIWNMDETGFRIGIPGGERVIVPRTAKQLYTPSPENRLSITILETVSATGGMIPLVLVVPGKIHMDSWYHSNLEGTELLLLSDTGYSNTQLALDWLQHFIQHTAPHKQEEPKVLLLDSHTSHISCEFIIAAAGSYIQLYTFPSHLTHILQPLDVGIFQPYKHYHKEAVLKAIRDMDLEYNIASFIRDLPYIREQTFKESTIISAFQKAGIWPISCEIAIAKLRTYSKPRPTTPTTPIALPLRQLTPKPSSFKDSEQGLQRWKTKLTGLLSSPSQKSYDNWLTSTEEVLASGQLQQLDLRVLQKQVEEQKKGKNRSRARLQVGGKLCANRAYELRAAKAKLLAQKDQAKEARVARQATNQVRRQLRGLGVEARKQERLRKKRVRALTRAGNPIPLEDQDPIPDPEAGSEASSEAGSEPSSERSLEPEPEPGFEPRFERAFELELEPGFELELEPGSGLAFELQRRLEEGGALYTIYYVKVLAIFGGRERNRFCIDVANATASDPDYGLLAQLASVAQA
ncbi:hypothetical protein V498_01766 [Pseudogymnoascus sp. VKM F-4517 (FW-2822)]|nr:hypothetical protein V498_01766 [Pseudogymnoascus sp. VKM F-4517 (FW-2822)]